MVEPLSIQIAGAVGILRDEWRCEVGIRLKRKWVTFICRIGDWKKGGMGERLMGDDLILGERSCACWRLWVLSDLSLGYEIRAVAGGKRQCRPPGRWLRRALEKVLFATVRFMARSTRQVGDSNASGQVLVQKTKERSWQPPLCEGLDSALSDPRNIQGKY